MRPLGLILGVLLATANPAFVTIVLPGGASPVLRRAQDTQVAPVLTAVEWSGKSVTIFGVNLAEGAVVSINGKEYATVASDALPSTRLLVAPRGGKRLHAGDTMLVKLRNPDGVESNEFRTTARLTVTIADRGKKFRLSIGQLLFVKLGNDLAWSFGDYDPTIIRFAVPPGGGALIVGLQGWFEGISPGRTKLSLIGDPWCRREIPRCSLPSQLFEVSVIVE